MSDLVLTKLEQTCGACPSQWEGVTSRGEYFYARYRWGTLTWGFGSHGDAAVRCAMGNPGLDLGDGLDGVMSTSDMLAHVGARVDRSAA